MKFWTWLRDNEGRIATALAIGTEVGGALWNVHQKATLDLGPGGLGGGLAAILTASAALLAAPPAAKAFLARMEKPK